MIILYLIILKIKHRYKHQLYLIEPRRTHEQRVDERFHVKSE